MMAQTSPLRAALGRLLDDYDRARWAHWRAVTAEPVSDRALTRAALDEAAGKWDAACQEMADLLLLLLRHCLERRKEALAPLLAEALSEGKRT